MRIEKQIFGRNYIVEKNENNIFIFNVEHEKEIPSTLYKYYALSEQNILALLNNYIFTPHPKLYNDPFDCNPFLILFDSEYIINELSIKLTKCLQLSEEEIKRDINFAFREWLYSEISCLSFTYFKGHQIMWSYYTDNKGFTVEFDYSKFSFDYHGPFPIQYQENIKPLPISEFMQLVPLTTSLIKGKIWEHEDEWRLIVQGDFVDNEGRKLKYDIKAIRSITLGIRFLEFSEWDKSKTDLKIISINIKEIYPKYLLKVALLDFLSTNRIETNWLVQGNERPFDTSFYGGYIEKISDNKYHFHDTKSK